jgi:hypothetical protein
VFGDELLVEHREDLLLGLLVEVVLCAFRLLADALFHLQRGESRVVRERESRGWG